MKHLKQATTEVFNLTKDLGIPIILVSAVILHLLGLEELTCMHMLYILFANLVVSTIFATVMYLVVDKLEQRRDEEV